MRALLHTLSLLRPPEASSLLVRVLDGQLPHAPQRWGDADALRALTCTLTLLFTIGIGGYSMRPLDWSLSSLLLFLLFSAIVFIPLVSCFYLFLSLPVGALQENRERDKLAQAAAAALAVIKDKRALPGVIEVAFEGRRRARWKAQSTLLHLLPLLGPEDAGSLPDPSVRHLASALSHSNARLVLGIVRALEHVGTGQAARPVEHVARRGATAEIRQEAARILPLLQERQRQEQAASSLLRAAMPAVAPEELLRPAAHHESSPPEQLLRPH